MTNADYARTVTIDRSILDPDDYQLCYIGQWALASGHDPAYQPVSDWADDRIGPGLVHAISETSFYLDEQRATHLFAVAGIAVTFSGEYPPALRAAAARYAQDRMERHALYGGVA